MGSAVSSTMRETMEENFKKNQEFMLKSQRMQLTRQLQMQNKMRERQMAFQIASARERVLWFGSFYGVATIGLVVGAVKRKNPAFVSPLIPLGFVGGYMYDMAYGNMMYRMRAEAEHILAEEKKLLNMPNGLPTFDEIENARLASNS